MQEALRTDDPEKHSDFHTGTGSKDSQGTRQAVFHGHGGKKAEEKTNALRYFQGKVYATKPETLPGNGELAAILRYSV